MKLTLEQAAEAGYIYCLLDGNRGIYMPQDFATNFVEWQGVEHSDIEVLRRGPESQYYWDSWCSVLMNAHYTDDEGTTWELWQDGDLFAVARRVEIEIDF